MILRTGSSEMQEIGHQLQLQLQQANHAPASDRRAMGARRRSPDDYNQVSLLVV